VAANAGGPKKFGNFFDHRTALRFSVFCVCFCPSQERHKNEQDAYRSLSFFIRFLIFFGQKSKKIVGTASGRVGQAPVENCDF